MLIVMLLEASPDSSLNRPFRVKTDNLINESK